MHSSLTFDFYVMFKWIKIVFMFTLTSCLINALSLEYVFCTMRYQESSTENSYAFVRWFLSTLSFVQCGTCVLVKHLHVIYFSLSLSFVQCVKSKLVSHSFGIWSILYSKIKKKTLVCLCLKNWKYMYMYLKKKVCVKRTL